MLTISAFFLAFSLLSSNLSAHGVHAHDHSIDDLIKHHITPKTTLTEFLARLPKNVVDISMLTKVYETIDENYLTSALVFNFAVCASLAGLFYFISINKIASKIGVFFRRNYNKFLNKYGYLRDFEADDPTINSTSFNIVGVIMNGFKKNVLDNFDFENLFNFFMLAGFIKELFLELFYNVFVYSIGLTSRNKYSSHNYSLSSFVSFFKQNESDAELALQNVSSLAKKIMFSYVFFYLLDRFINIFLVKLFKLDPHQLHSHSHSVQQHDLGHYLDDLNEKLSHKNDIKCVDVEVDIDSNGRVLRSYSTTTFDDGSVPKNEQYTDSEDEEYVAEHHEEEDIEEEDIEDSDFEIDDFEIEEDADKQLNNLTNLKFVILSIINDFVLNISSGISLYNLFGKQNFKDYKIFIIVWAIQYSTHVFADSIYMLNKTTSCQFSLQVLLSNLGVVIGVLIKHLSKKQSPILAKTTQAYAENNFKNFMIKLFDINASYSHAATLQLENAKVKSEHWIVETFYHYLNSFVLGSGSFDFEIFLLTFQIGFSMFLIFNKILPETKAPNSVKELLVIGLVCYLGYSANA